MLKTIPGWNGAWNSDLSGQAPQGFVPSSRQKPERTRACSTSTIGLDLARQPLRPE